MLADTVQGDPHQLGGLAEGATRQLMELDCSGGVRVRRSQRIHAIAEIRGGDTRARLVRQFDKHLASSPMPSLYRRVPPSFFDEHVVHSATQ
ncbi:MAG: hypothetical protein AAFX79_13480 [Planctomycetota bacterium]